MPDSGIASVGAEGNSQRISSTLTGDKENVGRRKCADFKEATTGSKVAPLQDESDLIY